MKKYETEHWQLNLPDAWQIEELEDAVSFFDPDSNGTLMISTLVEDEPISDEFLEEMLEVHHNADAELYDVEYGPFAGVTCCYANDEEYWCEWYLVTDNLMLYVTYNCPLEEEGMEDDLIESILESLAEVRTLVPH